MRSRLEFVRRVSVQAETITKHAKQYGWALIASANKVELFRDMVQTMGMGYSYKPAFLLARDVYSLSPASAPMVS